MNTKESQRLSECTKQNVILRKQLKEMATNFEKVSLQVDKFREACLKGILNKKRR